MTTTPLDRSDYPSLKESVYLNQASLGLIGEPAVRSMHAFLDDVARHGNLRMSDADEVGFFEALRERGARILNCDVRGVAITSGASELLGQLPFMIRPPAGTSILCVSTDFPAVTRPWVQYAQASGCAVEFVEDVADQPLTDTLLAAIHDRTAVIAVGSVQYATGTVLDVRRLRQGADRVGARLIIDATQGAGVTDIMAGDWGADAVVTSGYKWLGGHGGVALATLSPALQHQAPPLPGWMGTPHPFAFDATTVAFAGDARRFTQSTMAYLSLVGLTASLDQLLGLAPNAAEAHARHLAHTLLETVRTAGWVPYRSLSDTSASSHIISLSHPEADPVEVQALLQRQRIICGSRGGRVRISLAPYNSLDDVSALAEVLSSLT
ncbi:MAG: cysteine desulfurase/selenocysteine lyase [Rhodothermales bacterium]